MDTESFKADVLRKLSTLLQRLDALDMVITTHISLQLPLTLIPYDRMWNHCQGAEIGGSIVRILKQYANDLGKRRVFWSLRMTGKVRCRMQTGKS